MHEVAFTIGNDYSDVFTSVKCITTIYGMNGGESAWLPMLMPAIDLEFVV